tara:strand:+ start:179418 stop:180806 length:1389 start_codon:yes stop_codon:yes gene_type:complete
MNAESHKIKIHFIGVGGIGMSGIAEILIHMGYKVSGSDMSPSHNTEKLQKIGAEIYIGHSEENIKDANIVVYSSAIPQSNPEYSYANKENIPLLRRAEMLAEIMRLKQGIAIAGTHGKTTTTSILATILKESNLNPTYAIGGIVENLKGHASIGTGTYFVAEADESDGSFLLLSPLYSVITNIDDDHLDHYGTSEDIFKAFLKFANKVPFYGLCALNGNDEKVLELRKKLKKPYVLFGISNDSSEFDYCASNLRYENGVQVYDLYYEGKKAEEITLNLPGDHNVSNSLGAIAIAHKVGLGFDTIRLGISKFQGVGRRFQTLVKKNGFELIDDYGHHPTEIEKTIKALRNKVGDERVVVFFEPHRFTRTRDCWNQFLHCFNLADKVYMAPIYAASEKPLTGINSERLKDDVNKLHPELIETLSNMDEMFEKLNLLQNEKVHVITLGAGSIGRKIRDWVIENNK